MKYFEMNVGLENNPLSGESIAKILNILFPYQVVSRIDDGKYRDNPERTLVCKIGHNYSLSELVQTVESWCMLFAQESIAISGESFDLLVWSPEYKGDTFKFNEEYFIRWN